MSPAPTSPASPRRTAFALAAAALAVTLAVGLVLALRLRATTRAEMVGRDAEVLESYLLLRVDDANAELALEPDLLVQDVLLDLLLEASRLRGVLGVRVEDASGEVLDAVPLGYLGTPLAPMPGAGRRATFAADADLASLLVGADRARRPVVEVVLPVTLGFADDAFAGTARFLIDGSGVAEDLGALDRQLLLLGGASFALAALSLAGIAAWAGGRLERAARAEAERSSQLARASTELALAARSAAVGALAGHLVHGLKNPLAGLEAFTALGDEAANAVAGEDWKAASEAARRMRGLVESVLGALRAEEGGDDGDATVLDLFAAVRRDLAAVEHRTGVSLAWPEVPEPLPRLRGRELQLLAPVLLNVVTNALEASPRGTVVRVDCVANPRPQVRVADAGPGLPEAVRRRLFLPVTSTKEGGTGLGLALSAQLARAAGASLELESSGPAGTTFALTLPPP